jgi:hypothetical protein
MEAYETHEIFFKKITHKKMNELLNRFSTKYLENQINQELDKYKAITKISNSEEAQCMHLYISFYDQNKNEVGHISFHLNKENKDMSNNAKRKGRFHIVNKNKQKYHTLRVNNKNDLFLLRVNSTLKISSELDKCISVTLPILNNYFNTESQYSLKYNLTNLKDKENKCLQIISGRNIRTRFRNTRKQQSSIIRIPKQSLFSWGK